MNVVERLDFSDAYIMQLVVHLDTNVCYLHVQLI